MIFRYGYEEVLLRFTGFIKSSLDQSMCTLNAGEVLKNERLIQIVVKLTEKSLGLQYYKIIHYYFILIVSNFN